MRLSATACAWAILWGAVAVAKSSVHDDLPLPRSLTISIQAVSPSPGELHQLAEIAYSETDVAGSIASYQPPELDASLYRIGVTSGKSRDFLGSSTLVSAASFEKGYRPTLVLWLDTKENVVSVSCKSDRIDAGASRDFGPRVVLQRTRLSTGPTLNKPVVLRDGKVEAPPPEKTLLQK